MVPVAGQEEAVAGADLRVALCRAPTEEWECLQVRLATLTDAVFSETMPVS